MAVSRGYRRLGGLLLLLAGAALFALWRALFPVPRFPEPGGPYGIGTRTWHWVDGSRPEPFTADRGDRRRLVVQIWYPARAGGAPERYIDRDEVRGTIARRLGVPAVLLRRLQHAPTHAVADAPAVPGRFPVIVNPAGLSSFRDASLFWIEALASRGYIVVGLDQPGTSAATALPDGRVIPAMADKAAFDRLMPLAIARSPGNRAEMHGAEMHGVKLPGGIIPFLARDLSFVLDRLEAVDRGDPVLAGHLDLGRVGALGMSLGGYTSGEACRIDARFRACVIVDAGQTAEVARDGLRQPVMVITRDAGMFRRERAAAGGWPEAEIAHTVGSQRALFERSSGDAFYVTMDGMFHLNWMDAPIWTPLVRRAGLAGPIDPYVGFAETNRHVVAFFDRYLKGREIAAPAAGGPISRVEVRGGG